MTSFLNKIISSLPDYQKNSIKALLELKSKALNIQSLRFKTEEAQKLYVNLKDKLGNIILDPKYAIDGEIISSDEHNKNMESVFLDLNSLYLSINKAGSINDVNSVALESEYNKSRAAIEKLLNDVRVFSIRKLFPEYNEAKLIDFNINKNYTTLKPAATVSPKVRLLELPSIFSSKVQRENRLNKFTTIYTKAYSSGIHGVINKDFGPGMVSDQRPETFWGYMVMSDSPISQKFELKNIGEVSQVEVNGPVVEMYFLFSHVEKINTIRLLPFAEFPITVLDISYSSGDADDRFITIDGFNSENSLDWIEYNFTPVYAKLVKVTFLQESYRNIHYSIPKSILSNTTIFQEIFDKKSSNLSNIIFDSDLYYDVNSVVDSYSSAIKSLRDLVDQSRIDSSASSDMTYLDDYTSSIKELLSELNITDDQLIDVPKYEYILGMREIEISYEVYGPIGHYESERFQVEATPSEVSIEVDQQNIKLDSAYVTSTEWEIDLGEGRLFPIHPRNITGDSGLPQSFDERLITDPISNVMYTRLGSYYSIPLNLKKNGKIVDPSVYQVERITGAIPKLKFSLTGDYSASNIYTADYFISPVSYNLDVLSNFKSRKLSSPELFTETNSDNSLQLSKFPFINYEVINSSHFIKNTGESTWNFEPLQANLSSGQFYIYPTITDDYGTVYQTGSITGYSISGLWGTHSGETPVNYGNVLSSAYFSSVSGSNYGYFIQLMDSPVYTEVDSFQTSITGLILKEPISTTYTQVSTWAGLSSGVSFIGDLTGNISGYLKVDYTIGIGLKTDDQNFTLGNRTYSPITVRIGGKEARNITNYETLIHPAFSIANTKDNEYQFIQAGKNLYFNQKIDNSISVEYSWVAEYLKVNSTLRCNSISSEYTPKVDEIRILINNMVI